MRVNFARVRVPQDPRDGSRFEASEENKFRAELERAFEKLPTSSGGGGGGGGDLTAGYLLTTPDATLTAAHTATDALKPDWKPGTPNAMDDEMITAGTGYDPAKWTHWNVGSETYSLDANGGGLKIGMASANAVLGIEQPFSFGAPWGFIGKFALGSKESASNSYVGITIRDSASHRIQWFSVGSVGSSRKYSTFDFSDPASYAGDTSTQVGGPQHNPFGWHYLKVYGDGAGKVGFDVSPNGIVWINILDVASSSIYPVSPNKVGIFHYQADTPANSYCRFFRRFL